MKTWRLNFLNLLFCLLLVALIGRLFYWQVLNYNELAVAATEQHLTTIRIDSPRGRILSADGNILAGNQKAYLLFAMIPEIKKLIRSVTVESCNDLARKVLMMNSEREVINYLRNAAIKVLPEVF